MIASRTIALIKKSSSLKRLMWPFSKAFLIKFTHIDSVCCVLHSLLFSSCTWKFFFLVFVIRSRDSDSSSSKPPHFKNAVYFWSIAAFYISARTETSGHSGAHSHSGCHSPAKINCCARSHIYHCSTFGQVRTSCSTPNMTALGFDTASTPCACHRRITLALKPVTALSRSRSC